MRERSGQIAIEAHSGMVVGDGQFDHHGMPNWSVIVRLTALTCIRRAKIAGNSKSWWRWSMAAISTIGWGRKSVFPTWTEAISTHPKRRRDPEDRECIGSGNARRLPSWRIFCFAERCMRRLLLLFVAILVVTATASPQPLSNKEIALMLRSGYSSESVLVEITRRGALETLDPATRKSLLEFRASPQLIAALESDTYAVSVSEAEKVKRQQADVAARSRRARRSEHNSDTTSEEPAGWRRSTARRYFAHAGLARQAHRFSGRRDQSCGRRWTREQETDRTLLFRPLVRARAASLRPS